MLDLVPPAAPALSSQDRQLLLRPALPVQRGLRQRQRPQQAGQRDESGGSGRQRGARPRPGRHRQPEHHHTAQAAAAGRNVEQRTGRVERSAVQRGGAGSPDVLRGRHVCQVAVGSEEAVGDAGEEPGGDEGGERGGREKDGQPREQSRHRSPNLDTINMFKK